MNRKYRNLLFIFSGMSIFFLNYCTQKPVPKIADNYFKNVDANVKYVGIEKCKTCHEDHYNTFIQTGMGKSFGLATKEKTSGSFANNSPVYDKNNDLYYYPFWLGEKMYLKEFRLKNGDTIHSRTEEIKYIVGSGHHTNSHFWEDNGFLFQAPITFYTQKGKWDLPPGFETKNTRFSRKIDIECMSCHTAMPEVAEGSVNEFKKLPLGIDCERCHGPGELHVSEKMKGNIIDIKKEADRTIVNPKRLPWSLQIDVCQRCHLQGNNVLKSGKKFTDYRPGMKLSDVFEVFMPKYDQEDHFVMAGHAERFQKSSCFIKSNEKNNIEAYNSNINFTCITCHDPHISVRKTSNNKFNEVCNNCHNSNSKQSKLLSCKLTIQSRLESGNNCVKCHMPANNTDDIPHVTVHDHYIRKPTVVHPAGKPFVVDLYSVNNKNTSDSAKFVALITYFEKFDAQKYYLEMAAQYASSSVSNPELEVQFLYANNNYEKIANLAKDIEKEEVSAWTNYRIAKAFDQVKQIANSVEWYKTAWNKAPKNLDFGAEYANILLREKLYGECEQVISTLEKLQQKSELVLLNSGALKFLKGNYPEAKAKFKKLIQLHPDNELGHLYLAELCLKTQQEAEAKKQLEEVLRINPRNTSASSMLKSLD